MNIISLDFGESTGMVRYSHPSNYLTDSRTVTPNMAYEVVRMAAEMEVVETILVERFPRNTSELDPDTITAYENTLRLWRVNPGLGVVLISPGEWKPVAKARKWKNKELKSKHERDAYNMMRYWFFSNKIMDIGDKHAPS